MVLVQPDGPISGPDIIRQKLESLKNSPMAPDVLKVRAGTLLVTAPHRSYFLRLDDFINGRMLSAAQPTAWRYLLFLGDRAVAEVQLSLGEEGEPPRFIALYEGPFAEATVSALAFANTLDGVNNQTYEVRLLRIPAVNLVAIWLHAQQDDILLALYRPPGGLRELTPYKEAQIIQALHSDALEIQAFYRDAYPKKAEG